MSFSLNQGFCSVRLCVIRGKVSEGLPLIHEHFLQCWLIRWLELHSVVDVTLRKVGLFLGAWTVFVAFFISWLFTAPRMLLSIRVCTSKSRNFSLRIIQTFKCLLFTGASLSSFELGVCWSLCVEFFFGLSTVDLSVSVDMCDVLIDISESTVLSWFFCLQVVHQLRWIWITRLFNHQLLDCLLFHNFLLKFNRSSAYAWDCLFLEFVLDLVLFNDLLKHLLLSVDVLELLEESEIHFFFFIQCPLHLQLSLNCLFMCLYNIGKLLHLVWKSQLFVHTMFFLHLDLPYSFFFCELFQVFIFLSILIRFIILVFIIV